MKRQMVVFLLLALFILAASMAAQAETTFHWRVLRGSPRSAQPLQTADQAATWLLGPGKGDLKLVTTAADAAKTIVLLEQNGATALRTIRIKPKNQVSLNNGVTWQTGEFRNIVFGTGFPAVVFKGPVSIEWGNYPGGTAYYPRDLESEWVPLLKGACGNLLLWRRLRRPSPTPTPSGAVIIPAPTPTPPPIAQLPPPGIPGKRYERPERVQEIRSVHTVATVGMVPVPKLEVSNSANNVNSNSLVNQLMNEIVNQNTNVNWNVNTINSIMQQLQQMIVPIGIGT